MNNDYVLKRLRAEATKPLSFEDIALLLHIQEPAALRELTTILEALAANGDIVETRTNRYGLPEQMNLFVGRLKKNKKGFGFLISENPDQDDLFIPGGDMNGAMNQDRVVVRIRKPASDNARTGATYRAEGQVIRILERYSTRFIGSFEKRKRFSFVKPDDPLFGSEIFIHPDDILGAKNGDKVLVDIVVWPEAGRSAEGVIKEIIGHQGDIGLDIDTIVYQHNLSPEFPKKVRKAAKELPQTVTEDMVGDRRDFRQMQLITIDGADSKDLDDAVFVERLDNGHFYLGVFIADVGEYVPENSVLDQEAYRRGTSVYLVDRVLPMLPTELSNGICSLNEGEDRLSLACLMEIDADGNVVTSDICEAVIQVTHRMTYDNVNRILAGDEALQARYQDVVPMLDDMADLRDILLEKRVRRGAILFDIPESGVTLDRNGRPIDVYWRTRGVAETIIEECMIIANETVAAHFYRMKTPFIYRVHDKPEKEKLEGVEAYLQLFGKSLNLGDREVASVDYQRILDALSPDDVHTYPINMVMLRSMRHAYYSSNCQGHFGLAATFYTHFTSPIRRYSDLAIHRIIKEMLHSHNRLTTKRVEFLKEMVTRYSEQASNTERIAEEAERASVDMKKVEYMEDHLFEVYEGTVVSVTGFGMFVQLPNSIEGLVHISTLVDDFYQFDPQLIQLVGEHTHRVFKLGDTVHVKVMRVNVEEAQLDFELVDTQSDLPDFPVMSKEKKSVKKGRKKKKK